LSTENRSASFALDFNYGREKRGCPEV